MRHTCSRIGNALVIRWRGVPDTLDNQTLLRRVREARKELGPALLFCGIIPEDVGMPGAQEREAMQAITPAMLENVAAMQLVIEGTGVARTMLRTMIRGMVVAGRRSDKVIVHASFDEFLRANEKALGLDRAAAMQLAQQEQLV